MGVVIERWRAVVGREGEYEVSDLGRVRSVDRVVRINDGRRRFCRSRLIKPAVVKGHLYLRLGAGSPESIRAYVGVGGFRWSGSCGN